MSGILVGGIGNIFNGDDGFGVEVVQRLRARPQGMPDGVTAVDFGIRGLDLVYALLNPHDAVVLVDAAPRGEPAGTVSVIQVMAQDTAGRSFSPHALDPAAALEMARSLGAGDTPVFVVACEPLTLGDEEGAMGLSPPVAAAIEPAIVAVDDLVQRLRETAMARSV